MTTNRAEDEKGLRYIWDICLIASTLTLAIHCYLHFYMVFQAWHMAPPILVKVLIRAGLVNLFRGFQKPRILSLAFLFLSAVGTKNETGRRFSYQVTVAYLIMGLLLYFSSYLPLMMDDVTPETGTKWYIALTGMGYFLILTGVTRLVKSIRGRLQQSIFNTDNETFPQEERRLVNDYSVNLPAQYRLKGRTRHSWINFVNPRRGVLIMGGPGSGKSWYIVENIIKQLIEKGFPLFVYDFKAPDLTMITYNHFIRHQKAYKVLPAFYTINFKNAALSNRCNPLHPSLLTDILDAIEASKTILLSINRSWANKQGEFFVESPINILAATFWFLREYRNGIYCTLPHAIELLQLGYDDLFTVLNTEPQASALVTPFISAYKENNMETVDSQIASVRIPMGRLASPQLYYILTGNDFTLDINNPASPKIICLGNDPVKSEALAPVISLFCDRMNKIINRRGMTKCGIIYDEFGTIRVASIQTVVATGRSNDIIPVIAIQDYSQLKKVYSRDEAEMIFNMTGNIISGQVGGETAKLLSERFPRTMQDRESLSVNSSDTSVNRSKHLEISVPPSTISSLSSGEFVGIVSDDPSRPIRLKAFHAKIINNAAKIRREQAGYQELPIVPGAVTRDMIQQNYLRVKQDIKDIVVDVMKELLVDPARRQLMVKK